MLIFKYVVSDLDADEIFEWLFEVKYHMNEKCS